MRSMEFSGSAFSHSRLSAVKSMPFFRTYAGSIAGRTGWSVQYTWESSRGQFSSALRGRDSCRASWEVFLGMACLQTLCLRPGDYSYSMVAGGLEVMSYSTRLIWGTSLTTRTLTWSRTS